MTLSEYEQRTLAEIEHGCCAEDPGFAARMDLAAARSRRTRVTLLAQCAIWVGALVFVLGAGAIRGLVSGGVVIAFFGVAMIVIGIGAWLPNRARRTGS